MMTGNTDTPTAQGCIGVMVREIVRRFNPDRVILFGSHASGNARTDSDVDLMVVMPVERSVRQMAVDIGVALHEFPIAKDIVVVRTDDFAWRKDVVGTIEYPASREGRVLYVRQ